MVVNHFIPSKIISGDTVSGGNLGMLPQHNIIYLPIMSFPLFFSMWEYLQIICCFIYYLQFFSLRSFDKGMYEILLLMQRPMLRKISWK